MSTNTKKKLHEPDVYGIKRGGSKLETLLKPVGRKNPMTSSGFPIGSPRLGQ